MLGQALNFCQRNEISASSCIMYTQWPCDNPPCILLESSSCDYPPCILLLWLSSLHPPTIIILLASSCDYPPCILLLRLSSLNSPPEIILLASSSWDYPPCILLLWLSSSCDYPPCILLWLSSLHFNTQSMYDYNMMITTDLHLHNSSHNYLRLVVMKCKSAYWSLPHSLKFNLNTHRSVVFNAECGTSF